MSQVIDLLKTTDLLGALKTKLTAIVHPSLGPEKLFEVVDFHEDKDLAAALRELIIVKKRVCLIVPAGDRFENVKEGRSVRSTGTTSVDLIFADVAYTKGAQAAAFGGPTNVGVVGMKDIVLQTIATNPQLTNLRWCALYPTDGAMLTLSDEQAAGAPNRQAYVLNYETPSGYMITPITAAFPA